MFIVTGGAGFIGSNIVKGLEDNFKNCDIVVVDRLRDKEKWRNISKRELYDIIQPERLPDFLEEHKGQIDAVIHMGAISSTTETDADKILDNNFALSLNLWKWCAENNARFIYASSAATYGDGSQGFVDDFSIQALEKLRPLNAYGWSKHLFDRKVAREIAKGNTNPPQWAGLKFFNVYGPNEYHKGSQASVAYHIFPSAYNGSEFRLFKSHNPNYKDGEQQRDFVWVGDCVDVVVWLLKNKDVCGLFNVGTGKARTFLDLARNLYLSQDKEPKIGYVDTPIEIREKYQYFTEADMNHLRAQGYNKPFTSLEDGIREYAKILKRDDIYI